MKPFGNQYDRVIENVKSFLGTEFNQEKDGTKYATILDGIAYEDLENDPDKIKKIFDGAVEDVQAALSPSTKPYKGNFFQQGLEISGLGKPKGHSKAELQQELDTMSQKMGRTLLGYEENLEISVSYVASEDAGMHLAFRIADGGCVEKDLPALIRGTYSQVETAPFSDKDIHFRFRQYAFLTVPYRDKNQEQERLQEKRNSNWVDDVLVALPECSGYRVTLKILPVDDCKQFTDEIRALQKAADILTLYGDADWNQATNIGATYNRVNNVIEKVGGDLKKAFTGKSYVSGNYGDSFSQTRHQKNKQAEFLLRQIDQRMYFLQKAIQTKPWQLVLCVEFNEEAAFQSVGASIKGALRKDAYILDWQEKPCICGVLASEDLLPFLKFPTKEFVGFEFIENEEFSLTGPSAGDGMEIGELLWNKTAAGRFCLPEKALNRHAFVCGMTGAGKTNTLFKLLEAADVPFLVIEPVKGEYRALLSRYKDLYIYSMRSDCTQQQHTSILRINPFWFPKNTNIAFHIDSIKTIIASALEMTNAMPNILEQCMYNIYIKAGWNIVTGKNQYVGTIPDEFLYPTFVDLLDEIEYYLDNSKFVGETLGDYQGAMATRLMSFVNSYKGILLNTVEHPDYEQIMRGRSVIELEGLADDTDKCLVMGTILVQYFEYLKLHFSVSDRKLQHLLVIEEAHRLFKNGGKATSAPREGTAADPTGQLVESLSNIMAEIRAFGEGMIIVDQSPSKVAEDVIKNSSTKIVHRIDNERDISMLQAALLIPDDKTSLPSLAQGEALIRTDGMRRPCKVKVDRSVIKDDYCLSSTFQNGNSGETNISLENAFIAMAILSDDVITEHIRNALWCLLMELYVKKFVSWKESVDRFVRAIDEILKTRRKYHLVDGNISVTRHLIFQVIRQLRAQSPISVSVNEIGSIHLFVQRLFDFYEASCEGELVKDGNISLFQEYYSYSIAPLVDEYSEFARQEKK